MPILFFIPVISAVTTQVFSLWPSQRLWDDLGLGARHIELTASENSVDVVTEKWYPKNGPENG
jgi:hypothetical protein